MYLKDKREIFLEETKKQLIGIDLKDDLLKGSKPLDRFFTGFLFPIIDGEGLDSDIEIGDSDAEGE